MVKRCPFASFVVIEIRSQLKKRILVSDQGGREIQAGGIRWYFEDLKQAPNIDMGPRDFFEIASNNHKGCKLARSNYQFKKRQKELARKKKKEQKRQLKLNKKIAAIEEDTISSQEVEPAPSTHSTDQD